MFESDCVSEVVTTVLSIAIEILSSDTVVAIPVPPPKLSVSPTVYVSFVPVSAERVIVLPTVSYTHLTLPTICSV